MADSNWAEVYKDLGATPVINAIGSVTMLGGSTPAPEVREAMDKADAAYIPLMDLQERAGTGNRGHGGCAGGVHHVRARGLR